MSLADSFPKDFLEQHKAGQSERVRAQIVPGTVIRLPSSFTTPPKPKRLVVVSTEPLYLLLANTDPFKSQSKRAIWERDYQVPAPCSTNACFDHDCYIDCSNFWDEFTIEEIVQHCCDGTGMILGTITKELQMAIVESINGCRTFSVAQRSCISANLG